MPPKKIAIIATLDTKEQEAAFLEGFIKAKGFKAEVLDVSTYRPHNFKPAYTRQEVMRRGGLEEKDLSFIRRDALMQAVGEGASSILNEIYQKGELAGVIGIGGNQGTAIAAIAMQNMPIGLPKIIVSTVASGNIRPYIRYKDIIVMFSVADLLGGPNIVTRTILSNAAGALIGMAEYGLPLVKDDKKTIAVTSLGNTETAVNNIRELLLEEEYEVIAFHASGACGSAMEELIEENIFWGVLDLTTHELIGEVHGEDIYTPLRPRLEAAGAKGIPQLVSLGGLDYFCFGPPESIPPRFLNRKIHYHNPYNTNVRATAEELSKVGKVMAEKLNKARGPRGVIVPLQGWSENGRAGGPLYDPEADRALVDSLEKNLLEDVKIFKINAHINDLLFAQSAAAIFHQLMEDWLAKNNYSREEDKNV